MAMVHANAKRLELRQSFCRFTWPELAAASRGRRTARKSLSEPDQLRHLADFFRKRFAGEFSAHLRFHNVGSFNLCRWRTSAK